MTQSPLIKRLGLRPGMRAALLNPPSGYLESLGELPEGVRFSSQPEPEYDFVQVFIKDSEEFARLTPVAQAAIRYDGMLWICYPKKTGDITSDLSRDIVWKKMTGTGLRPVTQIAIDETWSALRFRPDELVKSKA
jgi:hypothetical protein